MPLELKLLVIILVALIVVLVTPSKAQWKPALTTRQRQCRWVCRGGGQRRI